jgi:pullulanase/glycogen debranching enzyme
MPDLNYSNPAVKDSIFDASRFWLQKGVDGFRIDAVQYLVETGAQQSNTAQSLAICREFNQFIKTVNPESMTVGEVWSNLNNMLLYRNRLDYCFEFNLADLNAQAARNNDSASVRNLRNYIQGINYNNYPNQQYGNFLTNHDQNRIFGVIGQDLLKSKIAATLLLTTPGLPYLYYGEEIGMTGTGVDEEKRLPMLWTSSTSGVGAFSTGRPWRTSNQNNNIRNVASMRADSNSLLNHYKKLIHLRANTPALNKGEFRFLTANSPKVIALERRYGNKTLYVINNIGTVAVEGLSVNLMHEYLNPESTNFLNLMDSSVANYYLGPDNNAIYGMQLAPGEVKILEVTNSPVTSAKSQITVGAIQLYPNPVLNELYILLPEVANQKQVTIQITDLQGRMVQQSDFVVEGKQLSLKLANTMKAGTYLVTVFTEKGIFNKKVVKQ